MTDALDLRPKLVGARVKRSEDPRLLRGRGRFVDDLPAADALHVAFRRSDQAHARIVAIDAAAARAAPGVVAVLTAEDMESLHVPVVATSRMANYYATPIRALARHKVRHVGEPVVAVLADSRYRAEDAAALIAIDYEALPAATDPEAAARPGAPLLHEEAGTNILVAREFKRGDVDAALAAAPVRVSGRFRMRRKTAMAIEPRACLADYDRARDTLTLHSATQVPGLVRDALVKALDMPPERVRVVAPDVGGGFGSKGSLYPEELLVALAARRFGRPVRWTCDRREDLAATSQGFDEIVEATLGLDRDGKVLALAAEATGDVGAYSIYPWTAALEPVQVVSFLPGPYRVADYRGRVRAVATPKAPTGPYRGVGRPMATFVMERLIDMAARTLGLDPRDMRQHNLIAPGEFPYKVASGLVWDRCGFQECLAAACAAIGYDALRARQRELRAAGRWYGIGIASYAELTGIGSRISVAPGMPINTGTETSIIRIEPTGAVTASFGVASHGQGLETSLAQVVADHLGARFADIRIIHGDSAAVAGGTGTYASRSMVLAGGAAMRASDTLRGKLIDAASHLLEAAPADLIAADGTIMVVGTDRVVSFREIARAVDAGHLPVPLELAATETYDPVWGTTSCATHVAAIEIDRETFAVRIERFVAAEDCGTIVNPLIVDGQVHGGVVQGIGAALLEHMIYDANGQVQTASLADYLVPSACEIPPLETVHLEAASPTTLGGYRGMGEGGTIGAPAAIANAITDALAPLGIDIDELPVTPERLYALIEQAKSFEKTQC